MAFLIINPPHHLRTTSQLTNPFTLMKVSPLIRLPKLLKVSTGPQREAYHQPGFVAHPDGDAQHNSHIRHTSSPGLPGAPVLPPYFDFDDGTGIDRNTPIEEYARAIQDIYFHCSGHINSSAMQFTPAVTNITGTIAQSTSMATNLSDSALAELWPVGGVGLGDRNDVGGWRSPGPRHAVPYYTTIPSLANATSPHLPPIKEALHNPSSIQPFISAPTRGQFEDSISHPPRHIPRTTPRQKQKFPAAYPYAHDGGRTRRANASFRRKKSVNAKNLDTAARNHKLHCDYCNRGFNRGFNLRRHHKTCPSLNRTSDWLANPF
ncbi:hypothetical protein FRB93_010099 [Tulasnella sp. JGI-2019a]|nr:hypothetical protein FRB93_010099 [Tulasnella sp. JGI-2019a]